MIKILEAGVISVFKLEIEIENTGHITNTYIVLNKSTKNAMIIDPAFDSNLILTEIKSLNANLKLVIVTHSHADHIAALKEVVDKTKAKVYVHEKDYAGLFDKMLNEEEIVKTKVEDVDKSHVIKVKDGDEILLDKLKFEAIHTPGHTKGSMVIYDKEHDIMFSGDTIFEKTYGRTDLISGSHDDMKKTLYTLFKTFKNPLVLPGHGNEFYLESSKRRLTLLFAYKG